MSFRVTALRRSPWFLLLFLGWAALPLQAQLPNSPIVFAQSAITVALVPVPVIGGNTTGGQDANAQWLKVEFHFAITPPNGKFLDGAEFKIIIEGRDLFAPEATDPKQGIAVGLTGTVDYVNLPAGRDAYGVVYVPPDTLSRFSTARGASDFTRTFNIHVEAYVGGVKVDYFDENKEQDANWYQQLKPLSGFVYRQDQSPFIITDANRYPPLKLPPALAQ